MPNPTRLVVKVGSSLLANEEHFTPRFAFMHGLLSDIAALRDQGYEVVLASSGSVALGMRALNLSPDEAGVQDKQAAAACGQPVLLNAYKQIAAEYGFDIAQILVTVDDFEERQRFLNAKNTLHRLLEQGIMPVVNENDTVAIHALRVGDNDRLAARVAQMVDASHLVLLTCVDGLYDRDPSHPQARLVPEVEDVGAYLDVTTSVSGLGSGGMLTKMLAANMAQNAGCTTLIGRGAIEHPVSSLLAHDRAHTRCVAKDAEPAWKLWLRDRLQMAGSIVLRKEAIEAARNGKQGIRCTDVVSLQGDFGRADVVHIYDEDGTEHMRGMANLTARDAMLIARNPDTPPAEVLGYEVPRMLINSNNIVPLDDHHVTWDQPEPELRLVAG